MIFKIRFLLTNSCSASCAYCHNEGQEQKAGEMLSLATIEHVLATTAQRVDEIVLSGGEPTLHPQLREIAQRCKASGAFVSLNSHAGHPGKLEHAVPWIDELKIHVDSFDPLRQRQSMGISIRQVRKSIEKAKQQPGLRIVLNHPLQTLAEACAFINEARQLEIDCKLIELLSSEQGCPQLHEMPWAHLGYRHIGAGVWLYRNGQHRVMTRQCATTDVNQTELFIDVDGIRQQLQAPASGTPQEFAIAMLPAQPTADSAARPLWRNPGQQAGKLAA